MTRRNDVPIAEIFQKLFKKSLQHFFILRTAWTSDARKTTKFQLICQPRLFTSCGYSFTQSSQIFRRFLLNVKFIFMQTLWTFIGQNQLVLLSESMPTFWKIACRSSNDLEVFELLVSKTAINNITVIFLFLRYMFIVAVASLVKSLKEFLKNKVVRYFDCVVRADMRYSSERKHVTTARVSDAALWCSKHPLCWVISLVFCLTNSQRT